MKRIKEITKHTFIYGAGNLISKLAGLILVPIYTSNLAAKEYGIASLIFLTISIISPLLLTSINSSVNFFYWEYKDKKQKKEVINTSFFILFFLGIIGLIILLPLTGALSNILFGSANYSFLFKIALVSMFLNLVVSIPYSYMRIQKKSKEFIILSILSFLISVILNIIFIAYLGLGISGIFYSSFITSLVFFFILIPQMFRETGLSFSIAKAKEMVNYTIPLVPSYFFIIILFSIDKYFLRYFSNLSDVGIYSLAENFGDIISLLVIVPFTNIWYVMGFQSAKNKNKEIFSKALIYSTLMGVILSLIISLFVKEFLIIFSKPEYLPAYTIVPIFCLAYIFFSINRLLLLNIQCKKKNHYLVLINLVTLLASIPLFYILTKSFGAIGTVSALALSTLLLSGLSYYFAQKIFPIKYDLKRVFMLIITGLITVILSMMLNFSLYINIPLKMILFALFLIILFMSNFFSKEEKSELKKLIFKISHLIKIKI